MESLLGSILCPTVLDTALYGQNSVRKIHFENVMKRQQRQISASQQNLRHTLTQLVDQATAFTKDSLLKSGPEVQDSVIKWLAAVLAGNEARSKGANQIHDGGDVQHFIESLEQSNIPMYQNLDSRLQFHLQKAKVEGFSTVGFGNNVLWLLFQLMLPLKVCMQDKVDSSVFGIDTSKANSSSSSTDAEAKQSVSDSVVQEAAILLGGFSDLTKMGDEDEVTTARSQLTIPKPSSPNAAAYNFPTKVFALTLKAIHTILVPTIKESLCYYQGFAHFLHKGTAESIQKTDACFGEFLAIQTIFDHEGWVSGLVHTLNWVVLFLLGCAYPEERKQIPKLPNYPEDLPKCRPVDAYKNIVIPPPGGVSSQWAVLPADLVSDLVEILEYFWNIVPPKHPLHSVYQRVDVDGLLLLLVFFLGSGDHVKNPSVRGKITKILQDLCKNPRFSSRMQEYKPIVKNIVSCMIYVFVAVEKTKQSYYDIRMQLKYQLRVPIMELFEELILRQETEHKENLREFATGTGELGSDDTAQEFAKFLNLLMNDATMQLDEGMDTLVAIRKRQAKKALEGGGSGGASSSAGNGNNANGTESDDHEGGDNDIDDEINDGTAGVGVDRGGVQEDERGADGQDMYARSRRDPKEHCRTYMKLGGKTIRTLWVCLKCESVCEVMIKKTVVLQQLVTNCLNACLDRLNGPKLQQLKAGKTREGHSINDFKDYNFFPEKLSTMVLEMYVYITRDPSTRDKVLREILADGRSFKPETFQRALNSARKYSFLTADMLSEFSTLVDELKRRHAGGSVENTANTSSNSDSDGLRTLDAVLEEMSKSKDPTVKSLMEEVEDKYLDPVMCNLMEDPVLLPTSQTVCDRSVIERMLLSLEEDPFTRAKLTIKELVAQPELKAKIEKFKQEYRVM